MARGGRSAALAALAAVDPVAYARTRNHLDGAVTRLSPYLRHGVLTLAEVRRAALAAADPIGAAKLVNELSWRDFYTRVHAVLGPRIWEDIEPYKTGRPASAYAWTMPADVEEGRSGLACVDAWQEELVATGYLHNHARMWLASYLVHHRLVAWQAGARWFLTHLLDGDPASNNLSWQWVASTWRREPYLWNRENLLANGGERYCSRCPLRDAGCPFDTSYAALAERLFPDGPQAVKEGGELRERLRSVPGDVGADPSPTSEPVLVWVHGERLSPTNEASTAYPDAPAVFVWDEELWERNRYAPARAIFIAECLEELPAAQARGDVAEVLRERAGRAGARVVATTGSASPRFAGIVAALRDSGLEVLIHRPEPFVTAPDRLDLRRHASYWHAVKASALDPGRAEPDRAGGGP